MKLEDTCDVLIGGTPKRAVKKYFIGGKIFGHQFQNLMEILLMTPKNTLLMKV